MRGRPERTAGLEGLKGVGTDLELRGSPAGGVSSPSGCRPPSGHEHAGRRDYQAAQRQAEQFVARLEDKAPERQRQGLEAQVDAARQQLILELGRYLVCLKEGTDDLNGMLYRHLQRETATRALLGMPRPRWPWPMRSVSGMWTLIGSPQRL